jgi:hypothetical protein
LGRKSRDAGQCSESSTNEKAAIRPLFCRSVHAGGTALLALALLLFAGLLGPDIGTRTLVPAMLLLGAAYSIANIPRMNALLGSAPALYAGVASAANNASAQLGNALGIAVTVVLVTGLPGSRGFRGQGPHVTSWCAM